VKRWLADVVALVGLLLLLAGLWWAYPPSAVMALGVALLTVAILGAKSWAS
jgi:hypothetical protein